MKNPKPTSSSKPSSSSHKPHPSSSNRKSRWVSGADHPSNPQDPKTAKPSNLKGSDNKDIPSSSAAVAAVAPSSTGSGVPPPLAAAGGRGGSPFAAPPQPTYGFQDLERRTLVLFDGSVRSYFALPSDYSLEPYGRGGRPDPRMGLPFERRFSPEGFREPPTGRDIGPPRDWLDGPRGPLDGGQWRPGPPPRGPLDGSQSSMKRKYPEEDEFAWLREHVSLYGNPNPSDDSGLLRRGYEDDLRASKQVRLGGGDEYEEMPARRGRAGEDLAGSGLLDVDPQALKKAFLKFVRTVNENAGQRDNYLEDGKNGRLQCVACGRASKEFSDVHELITHAYNSPSADQRVDHLGLHKALCVLMGWNYAKVPDSSKAYQSLPADIASANKEDLILWPPTVVIHNTSSGKRKDGRMDGMGNKEMDMKLKDLGFGGGKAKSLYSKEGHLGITAVKFANTQAGLKDAQRLAEYFEKESHGRKGWAQAQASQSGDDNENNPAFVKVDPKSGDKQRVLYGYLATAFDLDKVDFDTKKKALIKSIKEFDASE